jgi:diguanylate cyclase (GGDEF)-like protein
MDKRRVDELEFVADRDTLTGMPNRGAFMRAIEAEIEAARRHENNGAGGSGPCLAFIDVDHFKAVNDRYGHSAGDAVLFGVADRLAENLRRPDTLGRIGGEEFAVCMPKVDLHSAKWVAERLRRAVAAEPIATPSGPLPVTVSVGVTPFRPGDSVASMMKRADTAMYAAKRSGRDRVKADSTTTG